MTLSYSPLVCPFSAAINPHAETILNGTIAWLQQHSIIHDAMDAEWVRRQQLHILTARRHPQAPLTTLQWINNWYTWSFLFDDQWCEAAGRGRAPAQLAQIQAAWLAILRGGVPTLDNPQSRAFADMATRLRAQANAAWVERFIQTQVSYFAACIWEATNRAQHQIPDLAIFLRMRPYALGGYICVAMIEFAAQCDLPMAVRAHPAVRKLTLSAINILFWSNDLLSLDQELRDGEAHNLILILRYTQQCSLVEAVSRVVAMHDAEVQRFQALSTQLPSFTPAVNADIQRYIAGLQFMVRANLDWSLERGRYYAPIAVG